MQQAEAPAEIRFDGLPDHFSMFSLIRVNLHTREQLQFKHFTLYTYTGEHQGREGSPTDDLPDHRLRYDEDGNPLLIGPRHEIETPPQDLPMEE